MRIFTITRLANKDDILDQNHSDNIIDPFNHKTNSSKKSSEEEFQTARLHGEVVDSKQQLSQDNHSNERIVSFSCFGAL